MVADEGIKSRQNSSIGGKRKCRKQSGRGEREGRKESETTMTPIQSNEWRATGFSALPPSLSIQDTNERRHNSRHKMYNTK
ncbi:hypothetical protein DAPPUDRAFT_304052 [Daphnia pulex]|uniref:Uncharacterized protein n=1 Tax=Daphnia pulex TaxID=6669 RepID=E9GJI5_DAPPU|nr:hypothetical protein DAPPUDRAFT_304052 [Daphnia pulex]|eukprot:EFX80469.1 hypothetical protein DAPPUDRAFT_304052 [Daphnia pulex]